MDNKNTVTGGSQDNQLPPQSSNNLTEEKPIQGMPQLTVSLPAPTKSLATTTPVIPPEPTPLPAPTIQNTVPGSTANISVNFSPPGQLPPITPPPPTMTGIMEPSFELPPLTPPLPSTGPKNTSISGDSDLILKPKKKVAPAIMAIVALIMVVGLAGSAYYVSTQMASRTAVAPTAPESEPSAAVSCKGEGGECFSAASTCPSGTLPLPDSDCPTAQQCCKTSVEGVCRATCSVDNPCGAGYMCATGGICRNAECPTNDDDDCKCPETIIPVCKPKPQCLIDETCRIAEPAEGWCPVLSCKDNMKLVYKNVADNKPGSYNMDEANKIADGSTVTPGQMFVYVIEYSDSDVGGATIEDVLSDKLEYVDATGECVKQTDANKVVCTLSKYHIDLGAGKVAIRVKVKETATTGPLINNATITSSSTEIPADSVGQDAGVVTTTCKSNLLIGAAPMIAVACKGKVAMNDSGSAIVSTVGKNQTVLYSLELVNKGDAVAPEVLITDVLPSKLVFVESASGCTFGESTRAVSCKISLAANETKKVTFKAKTTYDVIDGEKIVNKAVVKLSPTISSAASSEATGSECQNELSVSIATVAGCDNVCTSDAVCSSGYVCDATVGKCRNAACTTEASCVCPTVTPTPVVVTATPVTAEESIVAETSVVTVPTTDQSLPEAGIFDLTGASVFGGGLLLAVLGILLAL